jgi:hypothetical protein
MGKIMSRSARLANFFRGSPGQWIDGRVLATVAGYYGWRSRVSDVRRPPYNLMIENRQRAVTQADGTAFTVSEYRMVQPRPPTPPTPEASTWELTPS